MLSAWTRRFLVALLSVASLGLVAGSAPERARRGMVVSQDAAASRVGADVLREGGDAIDAAVATAFALAVTHPVAGNIGGGGFIVYRAATGQAVAYDFRETAPAAATPTMFLREGRYDPARHHDGYLSVGVPGTVAGLHAAWRAHGRVPWPRLVGPAVRLAREGFAVTPGLAESLAEVLPDMRPYAASIAQFSKSGVPYEPGDTLRQPDLAATLQRIADLGPAGFYEGETALLVEREMAGKGGLITRTDLAAYRARTRTPLRGTYRGVDVITMPPVSSGGVCLLLMLNMLEGYDLAAWGPGSADTVHHVAEVMRRAYADRARYLGDPDFNPGMPVDRLVSKPYAESARRSIRGDHASASSPERFEWPAESRETTHVSVVDAEHDAAALTYTLENGYGSRIVVPGAGFLLNDEMGDFNAAPGLTTAEGLIGTGPNLAQPGKRMLSSMTPTILARNGVLLMVTGSHGGRTIINTVLETILNVVDFGMNAQEAVDAGRFHHQWLPDRLDYERFGLSPDTLAILKSRGHTLHSIDRQGVAEVIVVDARQDVLEAGVDRRQPGGGAAGLW